jgi:phospholipid/glycerol acyltransferase
MNEIVTPNEYSDICPFSDSEFHEKMEELVKEPGFKHAVTWVLQDIDFEAFCQGLLAIDNKRDFQVNIMYPFLEMLAKKTTNGISDTGIENIDINKSYTMITNHRDIVLDASFMNLSLLRRNYKTTEVAIGNNLLIYPWIEDLVRLNKSIVVKRDVGMRQALEAAEQLSGYIHFALTQKHESVWIAQRQGRAKDSSDGTQESLIKMLGIAGGKDYIDNIMEVNLLPVAISYEFDPNDYLKAREFLLKKKFPDFKKTQRDDLFSMETGLLQNKGRVHFSFTPCINDQLEELRGLEKTEQVERICKIIDSNIHCHYRIYPCNYIAYDRRFKTDRFKNEYTEADIESFTTYLNGQLEKVKKEVDFEITADDREYMLEMMLVMYSNPLCNKLKATDSL